MPQNACADAPRAEGRERRSDTPKARPVGVTAKSQVSNLTAAAAELDGVTAALLPLVHAAVEDRSRVHAARLQDARRDRRTRAGVADRHDRLFAEAVVADAEQPVRDIARSRDVAAVALVLLAHVDHLDLAGCKQALELVDLDRREPVFARRVERVAGDVEQRDRTQAACAA